MTCDRLTPAGLHSARFLDQFLDDHPPGLDEPRLPAELRAVRNGAQICVVAPYALLFSRDVAHDQRLRLAVLEDLRAALCVGGAAYGHHYHHFLPLAQGSRPATGRCYQLPFEDLWAACRSVSTPAGYAGVRGKGLEYVDLTPIAATWEEQRRTFCRCYEWQLDYPRYQPLADLATREAWQVAERWPEVEQQQRPQDHHQATDASDDEKRIAAAILTNPDASITELAEKHLGMSRSTFDRRRLKYPLLDKLLAARKGGGPHKGYKLDGGDIEAIDPEEDD